VKAFHPCLGPEGDAVNDGVTVQRREPIGLEGVRRELVVVYITLQPALRLQMSTDALGQAVDPL
jgi:hypothetical protein